MREYLILMSVTCPLTSLRSKKYPANIAIIPIADTSGNYSGSEYLQIYPVIKTLYNSVKGDYVVEWGGKSEPLADWLKR